MVVANYNFPNESAKSSDKKKPSSSKTNDENNNATCSMTKGHQS